MKKALVVIAVLCAPIFGIEAALAGKGATVIVEIPDEIVVGEPVSIDVGFQAYSSCSAAGIVDLVVDGEVVGSVVVSDDNVDGIADVTIPYTFEDSGEHQIDAVWRTDDTGCLSGYPVESGEPQSVSVGEAIPEQEDSLANTGSSNSALIAAVASIVMVAGAVTASFKPTNQRG